MQPCGRVSSKSQTGSMISTIPGIQLAFIRGEYIQRRLVQSVASNLSAASVEIDYVAAAHAVWLSGRTVVFLSLKWTPEVLQTILERANVHLILFGSSEPPAVPGVRAVSTFSLVDSPKPPSHVIPPSPEEVVETVPWICSITPTSGSTGVPKSIVYPMGRSLAVLSEESSTYLKPMDGQWLRGGTVSFFLTVLAVGADSTVKIDVLAPSFRDKAIHVQPDDVIL